MILAVLLIPGIAIITETDNSEADISNTSLNLSLTVGEQYDSSPIVVGKDSVYPIELRGRVTLLSGNVPTGMTFSDRSTANSGPDGYGATARFGLIGTPTGTGTYVFTVKGEIYRRDNSNVISSVDCVVTATVQQRYFTVTYNANGGSVDTTSETVIAYSQITLPTPTAPSTNYNFKGWYTASTGGTRVGGAAETYNVTETITLYAQWTENITYWSNGNPNGSVSILYHIDDASVTNDIITQYRLYRYDPSIEDMFETEINESFADTGYYINVEINSVRLGVNNYDVQVIVTLYDNNNNVIATETVDLGKWGSFIITVDSVNAVVSYTKVMQFRTFTDYQEMDTETILAYGSYGDFGGLVTQSLKIIPVTDTVPRQSVIRTNVFLNTYGVVLRDPSIDISQYFPELTEIRLNFYSFALYGDSMTINGHTMNVTAPNITVYYTQSASGNIIADAPGNGVLTKSLELTNIYITWDGEKCYLSFVNDNFTVDMGTYTNKNISFTGIWYYATALYEPYTATEKSYNVDWWGSFDFSKFGIIMVALLILGAIIVKVTIGGRALDYVIVICAAIIALIIAGGLVNA